MSPICLGNLSTVAMLRASIGLLCRPLSTSMGGGPLGMEGSFAKLHTEDAMALCRVAGKVRSHTTLLLEEKMKSDVLEVSVVLRGVFEGQITK